MAVKKKPRKGNVVSVDFTGVETGGRPCPDGTYKAEITAFTQEESSTGNPMIVAKYKVLNGKGKGALIYDNLSLQPQALFRLKAVCEACGIEADGAADLDLDDMVGQELLIDVENETYEDKKRPRAAGYAPLGGKTDEEEDESEDEDEDEDESEDEDETEDEEEEEKPAKKSSKSKPVKKSKKIEEEEDEDDEEEEAEEDDEEEEERPTKKPLKKVGKKVSSGFVKGAKVSFKDGKTTIKGTISADVDGDEARVEDKNGDEYDVPIEDLTIIKAA